MLKVHKANEAIQVLMAIPVSKDLWALPDPKVSLVTPVDQVNAVPEANKVLQDSTA